MLKVHEITTASGVLSPVFLRLEDGALVLGGDDEAFVLPRGALEAVMARFGVPFDPSSRVVSVATLDLGVGRALHHVRHLARYDVIARDYLVYEAADREPLCALATTVAGALDHLGRAGARHHEVPT